MEIDGKVVWITTRKLRPGVREEFREAWRPATFPEGMCAAYELDGVGTDEVIGISVWDSPDHRERYRLSDVEAERQRAMAPFVLEATSGIYTGRELRIPGR